MQWWTRGNKWECDLHKSIALSAIQMAHHDVTRMAHWSILCAVGLFFVNIYLRCKIFIVQIGIRPLVRKRYVHTYSIDRWVVFFLRLFFSVRLGLHASYQIIERSNHIQDIVTKLRCFAGDFVRCTIESLKYIFFSSRVQ